MSHIDLNHYWQFVAQDRNGIFGMFIRRKIHQVFDDFDTTMPRLPTSIMADANLVYCVNTKTFAKFRGLRDGNQARSVFLLIEASIPHLPEARPVFQYEDRILFDDDLVESTLHEIEPHKLRLLGFADRITGFLCGLPRTTTGDLK